MVWLSGLLFQEAHGGVVLISHVNWFVGAGRAALSAGLSQPTQKHGARKPDPSSTSCTGAPAAWPCVYDAGAKGSTQQSVAWKDARLGDPRGTLVRS